MNRVWIYRIVGLVMLIVLMFVLVDLQRKLVRLNQLKAKSTQSR